MLHKIHILLTIFGQKLSSTLCISKIALPHVPDEAFWSKKPNIAHLQEFECKCWVLQQDVVF